MSKIFIGMFFILFDLKLFLFILNFNILPDFIGYIILLLGIMELKECSKHYKNIIPITICMIIISSIISIINFLMININPVVNEFIDLITTGIFMYLLYEIILGIKDMEKADDNNYKSTTLYKIWQVLLIVLSVGYLSLIIPHFSENTFLIIFLSITNIIIFLIFVIAFYITKNIYNSYH